MFILVEFHSEFSKHYTYICKRSIKVGDFVVVPTRTKNTVAKVTKVRVTTPSFECKEVIKKVRL